MAVLYIVGTPIGNLKDITLRAIDVLRSVDLILCEDTRKTKVLLDHYQITTPTLSYHQHSKIKKAEYIIQLLREEKNLALVSDAGTPGISDPGNQLASYLVGRFFGLTGKLENQQTSQLKIVPIPGPSALIAAASVSGFAMDKFLFLGFPPVKNKRKKFFEEVANSKYSVIFYESPFRIIKTLQELSVITNQQSAVVCRELTKKFETIYRGTINEVLGQLSSSEVRGEFAVITKGK